MYDSEYIRMDRSLSGSELTPSEEIVERSVSSIPSSSCISSILGYVTEGVRKLVGDHADAFAIASLVSSTLAVTMSIATSIICGGYSKWATGLGIASISCQIFSLIDNITLFCVAKGLAWDAASAANSVEGVATEIYSVASTYIGKEHAASSVFEERIPNAMNNEAVSTCIKVGITSLLSIVCGGLLISKAINFKQIGELARTFNAMSSASGNLNKLSDAVLNTFADESGSVDYPLIKRMEELAKEVGEYMTLDVRTFVQNPSLEAKLHSLIGRIIECLSTKCKDETARRLTSIRQVLIKGLDVLREHEQAVRAITDSKNRQVTVGILMSGDHAIGKSYYASLLARQLAGIFGYDPSMYILNKAPKEFWTPYGGQAFGIVNEFMASREEDQFLPYINSIISSDPFNFESAHLGGKTQLCALKCVFITTNNPDPTSDMARVMHDGAVSAIWDRLYHVHIEDPLCTGRKNENEHRTPTCSHLNLHLVQHKSGSTELIKTPFSHQQFLDMISARIAKEELHFARAVDMLSPERKERLEHLAHRYDRIANMEATFDGGREYFVWRLQGSPGGGKTRMASILATYAQRTLGIKAVNIISPTHLVPRPEPCLYVVDDCLNTTQHYDAYMEFMNRISPKSVVILCSNHVCKYRRDWFQGGSWIPNITAAKIWQPSFGHAYKDRTPPDGILRRMGLPGVVRDSYGELVHTHTEYQRCFTTTEAKQIIENRTGRVLVDDDMIHEFRQAWIAYNSATGEIPVIHSAPPNPRPHVTLTAPSLRAVHNVLTSAAKIKRMIATRGTVDDVCLTFQTELTPRLASQIDVTVGQWLVRDVQDLSSTKQIEAVFQLMSKNFSYSNPGDHLMVVLGRGEDLHTLYYDGEKIYSSFQQDRELPVIVTRHVTDKGRKCVFVVDQTENITAEEVVDAFENKEISPAIKRLTTYQHSALIRAYIAARDTPKSTGHYAIHLALHRLVIKEHKTSWMTSMRVRLYNHPLWYTTIGIIATLCTGAMLYALYQWMRKDPTDHMEPNSEDRYQKAVVKKVIRDMRLNKDRNRDYEGRVKSSVLQGLRSNDAQSRPNSQDNLPILDEFPVVWDQIKLVYDKIEKMAINPHFKRMLRDKFELWFEEPGCFPDSEEKVLRDILYEAAIRGASMEYSIANAIARLKHKTDMSRINWIDGNFRFLENMITDADDFHPNKKTKLEQAHIRLTKAACVITTSVGKVHGLFIGGNIVLTVAHVFEGVEDCMVVEDGVETPGKCCLIFNDRDLALVRFKGNSRPDLTSMFLNVDQFHRFTSAYMLRLGPHQHIYSCRMHYFEVSDIPIKFQNAPSIAVDKGIVYAVFVQANNMGDIIKSGDCGFPLVVIERDTPKIIGVHNSVSKKQDATFAAVSQEFIRDAMDHLSREPNNQAPEEIDFSELVTAEVPFRDCAIRMLMPRFYYEALCLVEPIDYPTQNIQVLGYTQHLHLISRPRIKHVTHRLKLPVGRMKAPAALTLKHVTNRSKIECDPQGRLSPLWTQVMKYDKCPTELPDVNMERLAHAEHVAAEHIVSVYGHGPIMRTHQAINGTHDGTLHHLDLTTSAGTFYRQVFGLHSKRELFDYHIPPGGSLTLVLANSPAGKVLRDHMDQMKECLLAEDGYPLFVLSKDNAKVEFVDAAKAAEGKVRLFNELDLAVNLTFKLFLGSLISACMRRVNDGGIIKIGQDPLVTAQVDCRRFVDLKPTHDIFSTDFSACDKTLPAVLIRSFGYVLKKYIRDDRYETEAIERAIDRIVLSLTYAYHTCGGIIFSVSHGNESGSVATTLLNSIAIKVQTTYLILEKIEIAQLPSSPSTYFSELLLGDDRVVAVHKSLEVKGDDLALVAKKFGMICEAGKGGDTTGSSLYDFCSRNHYWDPEQGVCFPALKMSSISNLLYWFADTAPDQIIQNLDEALFEASLYPSPVFFEQVLASCPLILEEFNCPLDVTFTTYADTRARWVNYLRASKNCISLQEREHYKESDIDKKRISEQYLRSVITSGRKVTQTNLTPESITHIKSTVDRDLVRALYERGLKMGDNPIGETLELLQRMRIDEHPVVEVADCEEGFSYSVTCLGEIGKAAGPNKRAAKRAAFSELLPKIKEKYRLAIADAQPNADLAAAAASKVAKEFMYVSIREHLRIGAEVGTELDQCIRVLVPEPPPKTKPSITPSGYRYVKYQNRYYVTSMASETIGYARMKEIYLQQPRTSLDGEDIVIHPYQANMDVEPSSIAQAELNPGVATIPTLTNPTPTNVAPAMAENPPPTLGAIEAAPHLSLNVAGPPNMLQVGAIGFDLKDLVYSQFLDCDTQYSFSDSSEVGHIIFQIPYDPQSAFMNPYARAYVSQHERFTGPLLFRVTIVGNATFSGLVAMAWYPTKVAGTSARVSELQKYSYYAEPITLPSNRVISLNDARQDQFYRTVSNSPTDVSQRPHLVCFVMMSAVSPLRTGITIRLRVASKLAAPGDGFGAFQVANPILPASQVRGASAAAYGSEPLPKNMLTGVQIDPYLLQSLTGYRASLVVDGVFQNDAQPYALETRTDVGQFFQLSAVWSIQGEQTPAPLRYTQQIYWSDLKQVQSIATYATVQMTRYILSQNQEVADSFQIQDNPSKDILQMLEQEKKDLTLASILKFFEDGGNDRVYGELYQVIQYRFLGVKKDLAYVTMDNGKVEQVEIAPSVNGIFEVFTQKQRFTLVDCRCDMKVALTGRVATQFELLSRTVRTSELSLVGMYVYKPQTLPTGYRLVNFTDKPQLSVPEGERGWRTTGDYRFNNMLKQVTSGLQKTEVLQMELRDSESGQTLCYVRYLPDLANCVINVGTFNFPMFATMMRPLDRVFIGQCDVVLRTQDFPVTVAAHFASDVRVSMSQSMAKALGSFTPNAAMAAAFLGGGALEGIGKGLSQWGSYEAQKDLQKKDWEARSAYNERDWALRSQYNIQNWEQTRETSEFNQVLAGYRTPSSTLGLSGETAQTRRGGPYVNTHAQGPLGVNVNGNMAGGMNLITSKGTQTDPIQHNSVHAQTEAADTRSLGTSTVEPSTKSQGTSPEPIIPQPEAQQVRQSRNQNTQTSSPSDWEVMASPTKTPTGSWGRSRIPGTMMSSNVSSRVPYKPASRRRPG